ncbi:uncharacterized protein [Nothobranchius furzeri]|uniref:LOC107394907-like protein n=2 Tax=Nothobranchius furzeri TaxID=105023 RepID=A0A9D3BKB6_NOTFU|nr:putative LOC107394907-like protein [Nothobranchius furzeri]
MLTNVSGSADGDEVCRSDRGYITSLALVNAFTFTVGQPVTATLLCITFTSRKSVDILNCNLALFHNFLYLVCILHFIFLLSWQHRAQRLLQLLLVYAQIGGPMSLCFICLERYVAVIRPTSYPLLRRYRCREVGAVTVWVSSLCAAMVTILTNNSPSTEWLMSAVPLGVMLLMTKLMVWGSISIARALRRSGPGRDELHPLKRKAFRTVCATTALNLLCYIPVALLLEFKLLARQTFQCWLTPVCFLVLSAASVVHPMFYLSTQGGLPPFCKRPAAE